MVVRKLLLGVALAAFGCAQGGGSSPGGGGGTFDGGGVMDGAPREDSAPGVGGRRDSGPIRVDSGPAGCPEICVLPNATSSCVGDRCAVDRCDPGFGDCNGDPADGCEAPLDTEANCGACGMACSVPNGTAACVSGTCTVGTCNPGFGDCNGSETDGCETALDSTTHCGACGNACPAGSSCDGGSCTAVSCPPGLSNCDGAAGCEVDHATFTNTCAAATNLGSASGDVACGFACPGASFRTLATRTGRSGAWFTARAQECSSCPADIYHCYRLEVPAGVDYDLVAYSACGMTIGSLPEGPGTAEEFCVFVTDDFSGGDNSFDYFLEVRHRSGASCFEWRLTVEHPDCGSC